ncbi:MAG: hypothetical protein IPM81_18580 [Saprospirales bacterium]|nr:hypothetical protein [Saprospirales bacterium]
MKNLLIAGLVLAGLLGVFVACKNTPKATNTDQTAAYACPMHPEITGKAGDTCSKCGMDLEPVKRMPMPRMLVRCIPKSQAKSVINVPSAGWTLSGPKSRQIMAKKGTSIDPF